MPRLVASRWSASLPMLRQTSLLVLLSPLVVSLGVSSVQGPEALPDTATRLAK